MLLPVHGLRLFSAYLKGLDIVIVSLKTEYGTTSVIMAEAEIQSERVDDIALLIKQQ